MTIGRMYRGVAVNDVPLARNACLADAIDSSHDELAARLARPLNDRLTPIADLRCPEHRGQPRRAYDIIQDIRKAAAAALVLCDVEGQLDPALAQFAAEDMRRLVMELAKDAIK